MVLRTRSSCRVSGLVLLVSILGVVPSIRAQGVEPAPDYESEPEPEPEVEEAPGATVTPPANVAPAREAPRARVDAPVRGRDLPRQHDRFFLRLGIGPSVDWVHAKGDHPVDELGGSGTFLVAVGGCPTRNLVLTSELQIGEGGFAPSNGHVQLTVGGAVYYYIMPVNVFVGGGVGYGFANAEKKHYSLFGSDEDEDLPTYLTGTAVSVHVDVGKEWWVSNRWGIGLGVRGQYTGVVSGAQGHIVSGLLYLSATFN